MREELEVWFGKSKNFQFDFFVCLYVGVLWLHYQTFIEHLQNWIRSKAVLVVVVEFFCSFFQFYGQARSVFVSWNVPVHHSFQNIVCVSFLYGFSKINWEGAEAAEVQTTDFFFQCFRFRSSRFNCCSSNM